MIISLLYVHFNTYFVTVHLGPTFPTAFQQALVRLDDLVTGDAWATSADLLSCGLCLETDCLRFLSILDPVGGVGAAI